MIYNPFIELIKLGMRPFIKTALPLLIAGGAGLAAGALLSRRKTKTPKPTFQFTPFSGRSVPSPNFLRPSEELSFNTLSRRSQGQDVGFDPARRAAQESLLRSKLARRQEVDVRDARGIASRAGLTGNIAAQQQLEGRVREQGATDLAEGLSQITIEDLARANQERDVNTARLQRFGEFQFGQANTAADFDLRKFLAQENLKLGASAQALGQGNINTALQNQQTSDLVNTGVGIASLGFGGGGDTIINQAPSGAAASGTGIRLPSTQLPQGFTIGPSGRAIRSRGRNILR